MGYYLYHKYDCQQGDKKLVTIQPSLRPDADDENQLICVYGDTFFSF